MSDIVDSTFLGGNPIKSGIPLTDRDKIDEIIAEASKGSKFYEFQKRREQRIAERIKLLREKWKQLDNKTIEKCKGETKQWISTLENQRVLDRMYLHIDMDAFFAAVETLRRPELSSLPMAVGGDSMLSTANYEARKYGVVSAMPGYIARKLCPHLIILPPDYRSYKEASEKVRQVLCKFDPNPSSFSLDEASLDITEFIKETGKDPEEIAKELREQVFEATMLACSVGVACSRQVAKLCSDINKPNGQCCIPANRETILEFISKQPVKRINGVGKVMSKILEDLFLIKSCSDILENAHLIKLLLTDIQAEFLIMSALGMGNTFGEGFSHDREGRKSISVERTFKPIKSLLEMQNMLQKLCSHLADDLEEENLSGRSVGIKMKATSFDVITRAITLENPIHTEEELFKHASKLLAKHHPIDLRLLGIRLAGLIQRDEIIKYRCLDEFVTETTITIEKPSCPICGNTIDCHPDDTIRINEHVDTCLDEKELPPTKQKKAKITLDSFFNKKK